jgi:tetratricopeptide (TPR) repeat protein
MLGFPGQAACTAELAISNAAKRKHPFDRCFARHFVTVFVYGPRGDLDRAAALTSEMEIYATEQRLVFSKEVHGPMNRAMCMVWADRYAEARVACKAALERWVAAGLGVAVPQFKAAQAESALRCNDQEESVELLEEALTQIERPENRERYALAEVLRVKALALAGRGETSAAEALYREALETARQQSAKSWELRTATCFARHLQEQGRRTDALTVLKPVYGWFTEGQDTKDLREASALLAELQAAEMVRGERASGVGAGI